MSKPRRLYYTNEELFPGLGKFKTFAYKIVKENGGREQGYNCSDKIDLSTFIWACKRRNWYFEELCITTSDALLVYINPIV
uniref:Uncharacterized protein n=1 Tax=Pithovirus LCPAC304 TaxID=2506594 RepID=A0A481Z8M5_9VIRU|nr:MAG: hypothetical protein LCPAC304_04840 [Pithovirus LCPAC304]